MPRPQKIQSLMPEKPEGTATKYKVKAELFDKVKTYIDKSNKKNPVERKEPVNYRKFVIGGQEMVFFKDTPVTKEQLAAFDEAAKKFFLESTAKKEKE